MAEMKSRWLAASAIFATGAAIATAIFIFENLWLPAPALAANGPEWTQNAGAGLLVPACSASAATNTCAGGAPVITATWDSCDPTGAPLHPANSTWSVFVSGVVGDTSQGYVSVTGCGGAEWSAAVPQIVYGSGNPNPVPPLSSHAYAYWITNVNEPTGVPDAQGTFTTPGCMSVSCSVSPTSATTRQPVTWTAVPSGGVAPYTFLWGGNAPLAGKTSNPETFFYTSAGTKSGTITATDAVSVSVGPVACTNTVTVYQPTLIVQPALWNLAVGGTVQLRAFFDPDGNGPATADNVTTSSDWSSSNPARATVNNTTQKGMVTGVSTGLLPAIITASYTDTYGNLVSGTATIFVVSNPLTCSPTNQTVAAGQQANFSASGGSGGPYAWTAPWGMPAIGSGNSFQTTYSIGGASYTVTVSRGPQSAECYADVTSGLTVDLAPIAGGQSPYATTLSADVTSYTGNPSDTINYTFWWNCNNPSTSVSSVMADPACGTIPTPAPGACVENANGYKCDGVTADPQVTSSHTYTTGSYTAKVIAERGVALPDEDRESFTVTAPPPPPEADIRCNDLGGSCTIDYNTAATIEWCGASATPCANATICSVPEGPWAGTSGTQSTGALTAPKTYNLSCTGPGGGPVTDSVTVNVSPPPPAPEADITANNSDSPPPVTYGDPVTFEWCGTDHHTCLNAVSCSVSHPAQAPNSFPSGTSATYSVSPFEPASPLAGGYPYTLTCTNAVGVNTTDIVTVKLTQCSDGLNNDGDVDPNNGKQLIDFGSSTLRPSGSQPDPGCSNLQDNSEANPPTFIEIPPE